MVIGAVFYCSIVIDCNAARRNRRTRRCNFYEPGCNFSWRACAGCNCELCIVHLLVVFCGAGGNWTLVHTGTPWAFYTLIPALCFRALARPGPPTNTLASEEFTADSRLATAISDFSVPLCLGASEQLAPEWHLVPAPGARIKPVIYCTSIRQRERSCFRQLIFGNHWLKRAVTNSLRAYPNHHPAVKSKSTPMIIVCCKVLQR